VSKPLFENVFVALTTPICSKNRFLIDDYALVKHLEFLQKNGINSLLVGGTTGEFFGLGIPEKIYLLTIVKENFSGKIIFNVSANSFFEINMMIANAEKIGADAITIIPPHYIANASTEGLIKFLQKVSASSFLPCMLYNFTKHTQNKITPEILAAVPHAALKDSDKDELLISHTANYLCGGDSQIFDFWQKGAKGVVSVMGNYAPSPVMKIWNEINCGETDNAKKTQEEICKITAHFRKDDQIARIKYALSKLLEGAYPQEISLPLMPADEKAKQEIDAIFEAGVLK
jgi:4-hydroxy-tetrahydrodipicolinate synthase